MKQFSVIEFDKDLFHVVRTGSLKPLQYSTTHNYEYAKQIALLNEAVWHLEEAHDIWLELQDGLNLTKDGEKMIMANGDKLDANLYCYI